MPEACSLKGDHWDGHAGQWSLIRSPLRPGKEDIAAFRSIIAGNGENGLVLGVTPELAALSESMVCVDHNPVMISTLHQAKAEAVLGEWLDLPFPAGRFDFVLGDGSLSMLSYPLEYTALKKQLLRVLSPNGVLAVRLFVSPEEKESSMQVAHQALQGSIGSFHAFKWRFAMALAHENRNPNISVADIYKSFQQAFPDRDALSLAAGWPVAEIDTIDVYSGSSLVYSFPTLAEVEKALLPEFVHSSISYGSYELAERCPVIIFKKS